MGGNGTCLVENVAGQPPLGIGRLALADLSFLCRPVLRLQLVPEFVQSPFSGFVHEVQVEQEPLIDNKVDKVTGPGCAPWQDERAHDSREADSSDKSRKPVLMHAK